MEKNPFFTLLKGSGNRKLLLNTHPQYRLVDTQAYKLQLTRFISRVLEFLHLPPSPLKLSIAPLYVSSHSTHKHTYTLIYAHTYTYTYTYTYKHTYKHTYAHTYAHISNSTLFFSHHVINSYNSDHRLLYNRHRYRYQSNDERLFHQYIRFKECNEMLSDPNI